MTDVIGEPRIDWDARDPVCPLEVETVFYEDDLAPWPESIISAGELIDRHPYFRHWRRRSSLMHVLDHAAKLPTR